MKTYHIIIIFIAIVLTSLPIFIKLDVLVIKKFDESRLAINAYEMQKDGDWIVTHFEGKPDMWNTKPPLMIWLQVLFMKFLGINEWSVRLPAAFSGFLTLLALLFFSIRYLKNYLLGVISMLILVTSIGYMEQHSVRTGDYDALMTMFIVLYCLAFYLFIETSNKKYLYLTFLFVSLSVLTKGVAGLLMAPGLAIYALLSRKVISLLTNRHLYFGFLMMLIMIGWYYLLRESHNPGYLQAVITNELGGRYLDPVEQEYEGFWYYFNEIRQIQYSAWFVFLLPGFIVGLLTSDLRLRRLVIFSAVMIIPYFLVISFSATKHYWYALPMYPFFALILGAGIFNLIHWVMRWRIMSKPILKVAVPVVLLIVLFYEPYRIIFSKSIKGQEYSWDADRYHNTYFLRDALSGKRNINGYTYVGDGYQANSWFYIYQLRDKGQNIRIVKAYENEEYSGDILVFQQEVKDHIKEKYNFEVIDTYYNVEIYRIINGK